MKIALLIIYNHRYDKNIPILEHIYKGRFSNIFHIVPFYDGSINNVIPVYENSHQFQGYIAQAYQILKDKGFTHFFIVPDDMVINPQITENNLFLISGINENSIFISSLFDLISMKSYWSHAKNALQFNFIGLEVKDILPPVKHAEEIMTAHGFNAYDINDYVLFSKEELMQREYDPLYKKILRKLRFLRQKNLRHTFIMKYPLIGGYSDILLIPNAAMSQFSKYCGVFAASRLFVELAIPTSIILTEYPYQTMKDIKLSKCWLQWSPGFTSFIETYKNNYNELIDHFPDDCFYIHPVKLSKWSISLIP